MRLISGVAWRLKKYRRQFGAFTYERFNPERRAHRTILETVPELASYKVQTFEWLCDLAEKRGCESIGEYAALLKKSEEERAYLRKNFTLSGSHFFRGENWDFFHDECLSTFAGKSGIDVWCGGCSSGQEVYSTLVMLLDYAQIDDVSVLATDYNDELLDKCEAGSYYNMHLWEVPERYHKYLEFGEKKFTFKEELRSVIKTGVVDLINDEYPAPFDVIVCRNVIKFFAPKVIEQCKRRLVASLKPGGYLFVSTDDTHNGVELIVNPAALGVEEIGEGRGIYRKL